MRLPRFSLRGSMIALAVLAIGLAVIRGLVPILWFLGFADGTYQGPNTGLLNAGQSAVLAEGFSAAPGGQVIHSTGRTDYKSAMYVWPVITPRGRLPVASGTRCTVKIDPAWDDDSCSPDRPIAIELSEGEKRGAVVAVPRRILRRR